MSQAGSLTFQRRVESQSGSDYLQVLVNGVQQIQRSGSTGCAPFYFETTSPAQLSQAMADIAASVITCEIDLGIAPPFEDEVDVKVDGVQYVRLDSNSPTFDCDATDGWYYTLESTTTCETDIPFSCDQISLCGAACSSFKALVTPAADVTFFCDAG